MIHELDHLLIKATDKKSRAISTYKTPVVPIHIPGLEKINLVPVLIHFQNELIDIAIGEDAVVTDFQRAQKFPVRSMWPALLISREEASAYGPRTCVKTGSPSAENLVTRPE